MKTQKLQMKRWLGMKRSLVCRSWVRYVGLLLVSMMPVACSVCAGPDVHPAAAEHAAFCAQYYAEGKLVEAESRCRLAMEYSPRYPEPVNIMGLIERTRGRDNLAAAYFKKALTLRDDFPEAHNNLGTLFMEKGDWMSACARFEEAVEIDPGYVAARNNLGLCYMHREKFAKARAEYLKCVELDPSACDCRWGLGSLATRDKDYDEAKLHFQRMTEVCPRSETGFFNLCATHMQLGRCDEAVTACMAALAIKQDYLEARHNLTAAYQCLALEDAAVAEYMETIRTNPGDPDLHFNLGVVYFDKRLYEKALNEFLNTVKLNQDYVLAYYWAARIYDVQVRSSDTVDACKAFVDRLRGDAHAQEKQWCIERIQQLQFQ